MQIKSLYGSGVGQLFSIGVILGSKNDHFFKVLLYPQSIFKKKK